MCRSSSEGTWNSFSHEGHFNGSGKDDDDGGGDTPGDVVSQDGGDIPGDMLVLGVIVMESGWISDRFPSTDTFLSSCKCLLDRDWLVDGHGTPQDDLLFAFFFWVS